ncbi:MAG: threonine-phosphate decarboxylase [Pseudomonadota bacterium]
MSRHDKRDHGGNLDAAIAAFGGDRSSWLDLSTGINPVPYPLPDIANGAWTALPDAAATAALLGAARQFWGVPEATGVLAVPGASSAIAQIPTLKPNADVWIPGPTYNEHAASFAAAGWCISSDTQGAASVVVHPNNPDGRLWNAAEIPPGFQIIDESFCDICPEASLITQTDKPDVLVLKSFGKFWGLAGLRLGFVIGDPELLDEIARKLGPWPVSGPAQTVGQHALMNVSWADDARRRLGRDAARLDERMLRAGATLVGGTNLFRLYEVDHAESWQSRLARGKVWSRIFPYNDRWIRLGLPAPLRWAQLEAALT